MDFSYSYLINVAQTMKEIRKALISPSLILYFNDLRRVRWWLWIGGKVPPTRMQVEPYTKLNKREIEIEN